MKTNRKSFPLIKRRGISSFRTFQGIAYTEAVVALMLLIPIFLTTFDLARLGILRMMTASILQDALKDAQSATSISSELWESGTSQSERAANWVNFDTIRTQFQATATTLSQKKVSGIFSGVTVIPAMAYDPKNGSVSLAPNLQTVAFLPPGFSAFVPKWSTAVYNSHLCSPLSSGGTTLDTKTILNKAKASGNTQLAGQVTYNSSYSSFSDGRVTTNCSKPLNQSDPNQAYSKASRLYPMTAVAFLEVKTITMGLMRVAVQVSAYPAPDQPFVPRATPTPAVSQCTMHTLPDALTTICAQKNGYSKAAQAANDTSKNTGYWDAGWTYLVGRVTVPEKFSGVWTHPATDRSLKNYNGKNYSNFHFANGAVYSGLADSLYVQPDTTTTYDDIRNTALWCFQSDKWDQIKTNGAFQKLTSCEPTACGNTQYCERKVGGCFDPATSIVMKDGTIKLVGDIRLGDEVLNPVTGKGAIIRKLVKGSEKEPMIAFSLGGEERLVVTQKHPMRTLNGLEQARYLKVGDLVQDGLGSWRPLIMVTHLPVNSDQEVINFELEDSILDEEEGHYVVADGIITGDLVLQHELEALRAE